MDTTNIFRVLNFATSGIMILGGLSQFFPLSLQSCIVGTYVCAFGVATGLLEVRHPHAPEVRQYAGFMYRLFGRGVFYVLIGSILLHDMLPRYIAGSLIILVGLIYIGCEFVPSIEPPENMRDEDDYIQDTV